MSFGPVSQLSSFAGLLTLAIFTIRRSALGVAQTSDTVIQEHLDNVLVVGYGGLSLDGTHIFLRAGPLTSPHIF